MTRKPLFWHFMSQICVQKVYLWVFGYADFIFDVFTKPNLHIEMFPDKTVYFASFSICSSLFLSSKVTKLGFSKNLHFGFRIWFFGPFKTHFTLALFQFLAFFKVFFSEKPTSEAHSTNFFFGHFKKRVMNVIFGRKKLESVVAEKLWCPYSHFWNAHISLVGAQIFLCSKPLWPYCQ